jgi:hypothetical protein
MMRLKQTFRWEWPPGVTPIQFDVWIDMLPPDERIECLQGKRRQEEMRQQAIDEGRMIIVNDGYEWKDAETQKQSKGIDDVWERYWLCWQAETGAKLIQTFENK